MEDLNLKKWSAFFLILLSFLWLAGCQKDTIVDSQANQSDKQALETIVENDESISSFEANYNEGEAMNFGLGKIATQIYPIRVGQKMIRISKTMDVVFKGDTAYGKLTTTFDGTLFIVASYSPFITGDSSHVDTLIKKPFTTTIKRNIVFIRIANTRKPMDNWRIGAVSLPEGGTLTENIEILKMTVFLANGDTLVVNSPNDYFLAINCKRFKHEIPNIYRGDAASVRIEVKSAYADTDFVTLTYGANLQGLHRNKKKFELISQTFDGKYYNRIYEQTYTTHQAIGHYHAVINALPKQVIYDDSTPVESNTWGIPYIVR
jgi:hypothetical protein